MKDLTKEVEAELAKKPVRGSLPSFDEKEMVRPVSKIDGFEVADYRKLPNCLTVFRDCHAVPFADKTSARYLADILAVAKKPCRVVL